MGGEALARRAALGERQGFLALALEALAHERVQCRQPVQQRRGILGVQRVPCNAGIDERPQLVRLAAQLVVLLGGFDDGGEVDAAEALQLLDLLGDLVELGEHLLQQLLALLLAGLRLLLRGVVVLDGVGEEALAALAAVFLALLALLIVCLQADGQWLELLLAGGGAVAQLLGDVEDEVVHLLKLHISELVHKGALIFGGPAVVVLIVLEQLLQLVVVDVLGLPRRVHALAEGAAELHGRDGRLLQATNCMDSDSARAARNVTQQLHPRRTAKTFSTETCVAGKLYRSGELVRLSWPIGHARADGMRSASRLGAATGKALHSFRALTTNAASRRASSTARKACIACTDYEYRTMNIYNCPMWS